LISDSHVIEKYRGLAVSGRFEIGFVNARGIVLLNMHAFSSPLVGVTEKRGFT